MPSSSVFSLLLVILLSKDAFCDEELSTLQPVVAVVEPGGAPQPAPEARITYCFHIKPINIDLEVTGAMLLSGYWISHPPFYNPIASPTGRSVEKLGDLTICSTGKLGETDGTQGEVQLSKVSTKDPVITIKWHVPAAGEPSYNHFFEHALYQVVRTNSQYGHTFKITAMY